MTTNERIAEWLGLEIVKCPLDLNSRNWGEICYLWAQGKPDSVAEWLKCEPYTPITPLLDGTYIVAEDSIVHGREIVVLDLSADDHCHRWEPDNDITLWHGEDGLLSVVSAKGLWDDYARQLLQDLGVETATEKDGSEWVELPHVFATFAATPAQLTAALIEVIAANEAKT